MFEEDEQLGVLRVVEPAINQLPVASAQIIRGIDEDSANRALRIPATLAMTALRNLLDNALGYSSAEAPMVLRIQTTGQEAGFWWKTRAMG